jgi:hypothetical protein
MKTHLTAQKSRMIPADVTIEVDKYGRYTPWCQAAFDYCNMSGSAFFSQRQIELLKKRGHSIHVRQSIITL